MKKKENKIRSTIYWALVLQGGYIIAATAVNSFQQSELTLHTLEFQGLLIALIISALYHWRATRKEKEKNEQP
ncbi:hypothetical protein [Idiomarina aminovorans]|uniref:hypothetical protein n=1 Tax=Idiomarina aminovorans TaxID=2914829 RepID=UPI00200651A9|nr:hypothetical protein [Idiomarina sp. ATCH4]MCK7458283.1 hypothetical protein [Idiomarina sp. ATCH4]